MVFMFSTRFAQISTGFSTDVVREMTQIYVGPPHEVSTDLFPKDERHRLPFRSLFAVPRSPYVCICVCSHCGHS
jgi:hypothetical protein